MTDKELIKQDKEPKCIYNRTLEERKKFCKYCSAACSVRIEEEPASKDLEEEIDEEIDNLCELGCYMEDLAKGNSEGIYPLPDNVVKELRKFARHFAEWQKQESMQYLMEKAEEFLYLQLNNGSIECGNIERLIDGFKNYIIWQQ